jgi:hypothetical protein
MIESEKVIGTEQGAEEAKKADFGAKEKHWVDDGVPGKVVRNTRLAREFIKKQYEGVKGYTLKDIKPDNKKTGATVFVFVRTDEVMRDFEKFVTDIKAEREAKEAARESAPTIATETEPYTPRPLGAEEEPLFEPKDEISAK